MGAGRSVSQQRRLGKSARTRGWKSRRECFQKEDMVNCLDDVEKPSKMCAGFNSVEDTACKKRLVGILEAEAKMRG